MYRLTQLALARKSVTLLLAAGVFVGGILAWGQLKAELLPDIDFPVATVIAVYPGAGTTDVAEQVSAPIERSLSGVQGVKSVRSTSSPSLAVVVAEFEYGTDIKAAVADIEVRPRLGRPAAERRAPGLDAQHQRLSHHLLHGPVRRPERGCRQARPRRGRARAGRPARRGHGHGHRR